MSCYFFVVFRGGFLGEVLEVRESMVDDYSCGIEKRVIFLFFVLDLVFVFTD